MSLVIQELHEYLQPFNYSEFDNCHPLRVEGVFTAKQQLNQEPNNKFPNPSKSSLNCELPSSRTVFYQRNHHQFQDFTTAPCEGFAFRSIRHLTTIRVLQISPGTSKIFSFTVKKVHRRHPFIHNNNSHSIGKEMALKKTPNPKKYLPNKKPFLGIWAYQDPICHCLLLFRLPGVPKQL